MKFITQVLFGLIIINAMALLLAPYFALHPSPTNPVNISDTELARYGEMGDVWTSVIVPMFTNWATWAIIGAFTVVSLGIGAITGGGTRFAPMAIGIGLFVSLFVVIWDNTSRILIGIDPTNNPTISGIITLLTILLGLYFVFMLVNFFTQQQEVV